MQNSYANELRLAQIITIGQLCKYDRSTADDTMQSNYNTITGKVEYLTPSRIGDEKKMCCTE